MNIGIIGAMRDEITPLLDYYFSHEKINVGNQIYYKIEYTGNTLFIVQSKIGKVAAAMTSTLLIEKFKCEKVLFSGVAGGLADHLEIGDLVLGKKLCHHDVDITAFGHPKGHNPEIGIFIDTCLELRDIAKRVADGLDLNVHEGIIATGDQFISSQEKKDEIITEFGGDAIEMEGVAVAQVCSALGVSCLILRSISDKANGDAPDNFDEFVKVAAQKSSSYMIQIIDEIISCN
jgi:adenosylhomocysteine/aminodeoxyfutalosine nucleosidase